MKSMTGFGRASADFKDFTLTIDVSSVNKKGLEICVSLPRDWVPLEHAINTEIKKIFARGKFSVFAAVDKKLSGAEILAPRASIAAALESLKDLCKNSGAQFAPTEATILALNSLLLDAQPKETADLQQLWGQIAPVLRQACANLDAMRQTEGDELKADLQKRLETIAQYVSQAEAEAKNSPANYKETLLQKISALGLELNADDERVLREVCLFADKCDVAEEITRLKSHIKQFSALLDSDEPAGRKLDFLCQEMGREINTTASKANNLALTKITLDLKNELERIREQIQNLE